MCVNKRTVVHAAMVCHSQLMEGLPGVPGNSAAVSPRLPPRPILTVPRRQQKNIITSSQRSFGSGSDNGSKGSHGMADGSSTQSKLPKSFGTAAKPETFRQESVRDTKRGSESSPARDSSRSGCWADTEPKRSSITYNFTESTARAADGHSGGVVLTATLPTSQAPMGSLHVPRGAQFSAFRDTFTSTKDVATKAGGSNPSVSRFEAETSAASSRCPQSSCERDQESAAYIQQYLYQKLPRVTSDTDMERLTRSMQAVIDNCIFYPDLDSVSAKILLQDQDEGVFLIRNSSDPKFIFALSVKTERGATSVRIQYERGFFQLDCEERMKRRLPRFESVMELVDFHVAMCRDGSGDQCRWLETSGRKDMVVRLTKPRRHTPPTLTHLARLAVNQQLKDLHIPSRSTDCLPLPERMKDYLRDYPYKI